MDKADFVHLARVNAADSELTRSAKWTDLMDFAPLPPFGSLSSDMSRRFMRKRANAKNRAGEASASASTLPGVHHQDAVDSLFSSSDASASPARSLSSSRQLSFSPLDAYAQAGHPASGNEPNPVPHPFTYNPRLKKSTSVVIGDRLSSTTPKPSPGPASTAASYRALSTAPSVPQFTFGVKTPYHSSVIVSGVDAGVGLTHTGLLKAGASTCTTFGIRHSDGFGKPSNAPHAYDWLTDEQKRRSEVNLDKSRVKFGLRLEAVGMRDCSPGPAAYFPQFPAPSLNTDPEKDTLGRRLQPLAAPTEVPGPSHYEVNTAYEAVLPKSPAFTLLGRPRSSSATTDLPAHTHVHALAATIALAQSAAREKERIDARLHGSDFPTKPRAATFRFSTSKRS